MVKKESTVYLFIGQDNLSKAAQLQKLKIQNLSPELQDFNFDILYAKELSLEDLQEKILYLPFKTKKRMIVIRDAAKLKEQIKEFIINYVKCPSPQIILVLDLEIYLSRDGFISALMNYAHLYRFKESPRVDAFALGRAIDANKTAYALRVLNQLLSNQEKPERILGGLRYAWENNNLSPLEVKRKMKLLLNCDFAIKTGKLKADFALERLVVELCSFAKSSI